MLQSTQTTKPPTANTGTTTPVTPATAVQPSSSSTSSSNKIIANSVVVSIAAAVFAILAWTVSLEKFLTDLSIHSLLLTPGHFDGTVVYF